MVKMGIKYGVLFFILLTIWKWITKSDINWLDTIGVSVIASLIYVLFQWIDKEDKYKGD